MKRSKAQLNAISRAYSEQHKKEQAEELKRRNLLTVFNNQSIYKTMSKFLAANREKILKCIEEASQKLQNRVKQLEQSRAPSCYIDDARNTLNEITNAFKGTKL